MGGSFPITHGMSATTEYRIWCQMRNRCLRPSQPSFRLYGGKGIKVCDRWLESFENFYDDMGPRPSAAHSLDRLDSAGDYERTNCRWATPFEQANNTNRNQRIEWNGRNLTYAEWHRETGIPAGTIRRRILAGRSIVDALTAPIADWYALRRRDGLE